MPGYAVTTLRLFHFRNHLSVTLHLDGRSAALIGPNGVGKTNVLEALSYLSPGRGLRRARAEEAARLPEGIGWKIGARIDGPQGTHDIETAHEPGTPRRVRIDGKQTSQLALGDILRVLWLVPAMDRLWTGATEERRRFLDRIALSFFPDHVRAVLAYERAMRERNRLLRDQVRDAHWYRALEGRMAEAGQQLTANRRAAIRRLMQAEGHADNGFPRAALDLLAPDDADDASDAPLDAALARSRPRDLAAGRTLVGPHRADLGVRLAATGLPAAQCSTGEQKALLLGIVLANARALAADGGAPLLLLDEVAAHLDPGRRTALYDQIAALGAQALMTGTEPALFAGLDACARRFTLAPTPHGARFTENPVTITLATGDATPPGETGAGA